MKPVWMAGCLLVAAALWQGPGAAPGQDKKAGAGRNLPSGHWKLTYDYKVDGALKPDEGAAAQLKLEIRGNQVTGGFDDPKYADNKSIFTGEVVHTTQGTVFILKQVDRDTAAVHVGRLVGRQKFTGTWLESKPDGLAGEFELSFVGK